VIGIGRAGLQKPSQGRASAGAHAHLRGLLCGLQPLVCSTLMRGQGDGSELVSAQANGGSGCPCGRWRIRAKVSLLHDGLLGLGVVPEEEVGRTRKPGAADGNASHSRTRRYSVPRMPRLN